MALLGKIDMNNPQITFGCFEERAFDSDVHCALLLIVATDEDSRRISKNRGLLQVYFGRLVCSPSRWKFDGPIIVLSRSRKDRLDLLSRDLTLRDVNTLEIQAWRQKYLCWWPIRHWYDPGTSPVAAAHLNFRRLPQVSSSMTPLLVPGVWYMYALYCLVDRNSH